MILQQRNCLKDLVLLNENGHFLSFTSSFTFWQWDLTGLDHKSDYGIWESGKKILMNGEGKAMFAPWEEQELSSSGVLRSKPFLNPKQEFGNEDHCGVKNIKQKEQVNIHR